MIYPMIDPSFSPYGRVEQLPPRQDLDSIPLEENSHICLYCFPQDTFWDYDREMTILLILQDGQWKRFYLDRAVTIYAGVCFGFYPMARHSAITGDGSVLAEPYRADRVPIPDHTPRLQPLQIFTLFHQTGNGGLYFRGEQHPPVELVYLEKGTLHTYCDGQDFLMHPHEVLLIAPGQWHTQYADEDVRFLTISFLWEDHDFSPWYNQVFPATQDMQRAIYDLLQENSQFLADRDEFLHAQLKLLLLRILRQNIHTEQPRRPSPAAEQAHRKILNQALQAVSDKFRDKLTVPLLAAAVNVSPSQLTALFRTYLGISPAKYITRIRLEESKVLLSTHRMSIGETSAQLGYASIQHFSRQFRDWFGCSPSDFVKNQSMQ